MGRVEMIRAKLVASLLVLLTLFGAQSAFAQQCEMTSTNLPSLQVVRGSTNNVVYDGRVQAQIDAIQAAGCSGTDQQVAAVNLERQNPTAYATYNLASPVTVTLATGGTMTITNYAGASPSGGAARVITYTPPASGGSTERISAAPAVTTNAIHRFYDNGQAVGVYIGFTVSIVSPNAPTAALTSLTPSTIYAGQSSTVVVTLTNPNSSAALTGVANSITLPSGVTVAATPGASTTCTSGSVTATAGAGSVSLSGATMAAGATCTMTFNVTSTTVATHSINSGTPSATGANAGSAGTSSNLTVQTAPSAPTIAAAFSPATIATSGTSTLTLTINNPNGSAQLTGVGFNVGALPGTLTGASPGTTCSSGTATYNNGTKQLSLSGATLNANASCTVTLTASSTTPGSFTYTSGTVFATGPVSLTGTFATSNALAIYAPPTISAAFGTSPISTSGSTTLNVTITNPAGNPGSISGLAMAASTLNGLTGASPTTNCGGTVTATANLSFSGGTAIAAGATCVFGVTVSSASANTYNFTPGIVSATGPVTLTGVAGSQVSLTVAAPPVLGLTLASGGTPAQGGTFTLTPTITNSGGSATSGNLTLSWTVPTGFSLGGVAYSAPWDCAASTASALSCVFSGTVAVSGTASPDIVVTVAAAADAPTSVTPSFTVTGGGSANASGSTTVTIAQVADLVAITSGNNQSATVSTAFGAPLVVTVRDAGGVVIPGASVTFTAPASGASGTFAGSTTNTETVTANGSGVATSSAFTANATAGGYQVSATSGSKSANFSLTNNAATPTATSLTPTSGPIAGGTTVTVAGSNFVIGDTSVTIGGITIASGSVTVTSGTSLSFSTPAHAAGNVAVTVTTAGGTSGAVPGGFTYVAAPTASSLSPTAGPIAGGTTVTVTGTGFVVGDTSVTIDGTVIPAGSVTVSGATSLSFTTPAHAAGNVAVSVTTAGGTSGAVPGGFTYLAVPTASSLAPPSGSTLGGTSVTITGTGFVAGDTSVTIGATVVPSSSVSVTNATTLVFSTPANAAGTVSVSVTTSGGTSGNVPGGFQYVSSPPVLSVSVASGGTPVQGGSFTLSPTVSNTGGDPTSGNLTLTSTLPTGLTNNGTTASPGWDCATSTSTVVTCTYSGTIGGGLDATSLTVSVGVAADAPTSVAPTFTVSGGGAASPASGSTTVTIGQVANSVAISAGGGQSASVNTAFGTALAVAVTDAGGVAIPGASVTFTAPGSGASGVFAGSGTNSETVTADGSGIATASTFTANGTAGAYQVSATSGSASVNIGLTNTLVTPTVTSVAPSAGLIAGSTSVTITGTGFTGVAPNNAVTFDGTVASYTVQSDTSITATTPAHAAGLVDVAVTNAAGTGTGTGAFLYFGAPTINAITTPTTDNTPTITGTGAPGATINLTLTGPSALSTSAITVDGSGNWTFTPSARADGDYTASATQTLQGSTSTASSGVAFTIDTAAPAAPTIDAPTEGAITGTTPTISGTAESLSSVALTISGPSASTPTVSADGSGNWTYNATLTAGSYTVTAVATDAAGNASTASATRNFTVAATPTISVIAPDSGPTAGGTSVTITGTNLASTSSVTFGANAATIVGTPTATSVQVTAPSGAAGAVTVTVTTAGGTATTSYTYVAAPTVGAPSPDSGPTAGGTSVTLTGTNLTGATLTVDGAPVTPASNTGTSLTFTTPSHAAGAVTVAVTTTGGTASTSFTYVAAPTVGTPSPDNGPTAGGTSVTLTGTNLTGATLTVDGAPVTPSANTGTSLTFTTPSHAAGAVAVVVTTVGGSASTSFTYVGPPALTANTASAVAYNSTGNAIDATTLTSPTNSPTGWEVAASSGGTFGSTSASANGGSATINASGTISYDAPAGFRGNDTLYVRASNASGNSNVVALTIPVNDPTLTISLTGSGVQGTALSGVLIATSGGTAPYSCDPTLASGALPGGTQLNADCTISGTPNAAGSFSFTASVTDNSSGTGPVTTTSGTLTLTVAAPTLTMTPAAGALPGATPGVSYSQSFTTSGGSPGYTYALTAGAFPGGLTLTGDTLSGVPTAIGTFNFTITATDNSTGGGPYTVANSYSITVAAPAITVDPTALTDPTVGVAYSGTVTASGGSGTYTYAVTTGALPAGLSLASDGTLSGTATEGGAVSFTITATDTVLTGAGAPYTGSRAYTVTVGAPTIVLAPTSLPGGAVDAAYSQTITASGGTAGYTFAETGTLPPGLTLQSNGTLAGTATTAGTYNFTVTGTDSSTGTGAPFAGARAYTITIGQAGQTITFNPLSNASLSASPLTLSASASSTLTVAFTSATTTVCTVSGTTLTLLQTGLCTIDANQAGDANYSAAPQVSQSFTVTPATLAIATNAPTGTAVGASYSQTNPASGGTAPYTYARASGALPAGTTLDTSTGTVSGTPTTAGGFNYSIQATDSQGAPVTATGTTVSGTIAKGNQTISFTSTAPASATVGGATYTPTATAASGLTVSFTIDASASGICTISGGTVSFTGTGTCVINGNQAGDSNWNAAAQVQQSFAVGQGAQTISFTSTAPASATVGGATYTPTAIATSGLAVTFTIDASASGVCTISGGTVSFTGPGTCTVNANQAGNATYSPASQVQQSFAVGQGAQTISFTSTAPAGATVGGATYTPTATATSGLAVAFTVDASASGICTISGGTVSFTGVGTCVVNANQAGNSTYNAAPQVQQGFAVSQGAQTISFTSTAPASAAVGGATYTPTATATSGLSVAFTVDASASGICTISGGTVSFTGVGTCVINGNQAGNANYSAAPQVSQSFTVTPATLAIATNAPTGTTVGASYSQTNPASGGTAPYTYARASGALPAGTTLDTSTGTVSGTPTTAGGFNYSIQATDSQGAPVTATGTTVSGTIAKGNQTISFTSTAPASATVGGATYTPTATAASGLTVSFTIDASASGVCTISGGTVSFTSNGTCVINANQAGDTNWNAAAQVQQSFAVGASNQTISFTSTAPANALVGGATYTPTATATSGLAVSFTIDGSASTVCTISGGVVSFTGAGTCVINGNQAGNGSYNAAPQVQQSFTVRALPTVTNLSPDSGVAGGGNSVTLTGSDFTGVTAVNFGGNPASFTPGTATQLTATAPAGSGTVNVTVTTAAGTSATGAGNQYTYVAAPALNPFTSSAVAYGATGVNIDVRTDSGATNNPSAWEVASASGGTFGASSATAQGGTVSIDSAGQVSYAAPAGFRGNDAFYVRASNASGPSNVAAVTVPVDNPTLVIASAGSGTRGTALAGVQVIVSGGTAPYHCGTAVASGALPPGTQLNDDCTITGTPSASGTFNFTVSVTDSSVGLGGFTQASGGLSLTVAAPTVTISPAAGTLPGATAGAAYSQAFTASGGTAGYSFSLSAGAFPTGLTLSGGTLSGTPTATGTFNFSIEATDSSVGGGPYSATNSYSITVAAPLIVQSSFPLPGGTFGVAYASSVTASGGTAPYTYSITAGVTPTGVGLDPATGALTGTPTATGSFTFNVAATDSTTGAGAPYSGLQGYTIIIDQAGQTITFNPLSNASQSASPLTLSATASSGLTVAFTSATTTVCTVSGTTLTLVQPGLCTINANQFGNTNYTAAPQVQQSFTVTPATLVIATNAPTGTTVGASYSQTNPASGGVAPYTYSRASGALPAGTTLDTSTGTVSGTPTTAGGFNYSIQATDSQGAPVTATGTTVSGTIAKGNQTISFTSTAPASATVGGATYTPTASAASGLTVVFTIDASASGVCTISGGTVSFTGTGNCVINANQAGDGNWNPAGQVQQSFAVTAAMPIVTSLTPSSGSTAGNNTVVVTGSGFTGATAVGFGGTPAMSFLVDSDTQITAVAPAGSASANVAVTTPGGTSVAAAGALYTWIPPAPIVTAPTNGATLTTATPTYSGTAAENSTVAISVDGGAVNNVTANGSGNWTYTQAPALADGPHTVQATSSLGGITGSPSSVVNFTIDATAPAAPAVTAPAHGSTTSDSTPTVTGTAEANATVTIVIDGAVAGTTTATGGSWTFTSGLLGDGSHAVRATATDASGNVSPSSATNSFTVDATAPAAPVMTRPIDGSSVSLNTPVIYGTAEAGSTVTITVDGAVVGTTVATGGNWDFTSAMLADGPHTTSATATDGAGNVSPASPTVNFTIDTVDPTRPNIFTPSNGQTFTTNTITVAGSAEPNMTVRVYLDGPLAGTAPVDGSGNWAFAPAAPLGEGGHTVRAVTVDAAGNTSPSTMTNAFSIDTIVPAAPVVTTPVNGSTIADNTPTISGTAETSTTVSVTVDGVVVANMTAVGGNWSFTSATLGDGPHTISAITTDGVGNVSPASATVSFTVDTTAPGAPVVTAPADGSSTTDNTPAITGTAEAGSTVTVVIDGATAGTTIATGGTWSFTSATLADGPHTVSAIAADASGNASPSSATVTFTVDSTAPAAPAVTSPADGTIVATTTPAISGSAEANSTVTVVIDGATAGTTTATAGGAWSFTSATLGQGPHTVRAIATDAGGNVSPSSATNNFTVDTAAPVAPVVTVPAEGATVTDNTPDITGTAEAGSTVTVVIDGATAGTTTATGGNWSFTSATLADGPHTVRAIATDSAGNVSASSATRSFIVDATAPAAPVITAPANGSTVTTTTPLISGTAEANASVAVQVDGTTVATVTASAGGAWSFQTVTPLGNGPHSASAIATDAAGNASAASTVNFTVALAPVAADKPGVTVGYQTATAIDLSGSITGAHTSIAIGTAPAHGTTSIAGDVLTYTPAAGYFGADSFTYTATGPGGTSNVATVSLTVATPAAPVAADRNGVAIPYNSAGTAIDLSTSITGVHSSIAIGAAPAHGTTSIAGDVVTYTPTAGYFGADSFTYTATGPGGTSNVATVSVNVATPAAPVAADKSGVAVPYNSAGTAIDLSASITGLHTSVAIGAAPAHGTTSIAGDVVTYTPTAGYFGPDSFTYTATGPGGTSNVATVSVTVATPAAPVAADKNGVAIPYNSAGTAIDLSTSITGVHSSIAIGTAPAHGSTSIAGDVVTYTPAAGYFGADSFTYTATGPGGTSNVATVSINVGTPAAPVAANRSGVPVAYNSAGTAIDLSTSITGVHTSIAIGAAPAHGTTSIAGDVVTYTPTAGYFGVDSFTYTATGPGGTSNVATVSVNVATPAAPVAANRSGVAVPYNSAGTAIDLSTSITGVHTSIAIGTAPAHGTTSIAGDVVTYTPAAGYFGADSFTYTATGPGGTSNVATVSLTVATPAAPVAANRNGVAIPYNSAGTAIDLSTSITGVHTSIAIGTAPAHGTTSIAGDIVTYTPATGYYGADSFTYTATGPGGTSNVATVSLTVANPPPPVSQPGSGTVAGSVSANTSVDIDLSALVTGEYDTISIDMPPAHGTVTLRVTGGQAAAGERSALAVGRTIATYRPNAGYVGTDTFTFYATGPGGRSGSSAVTINVVGSVPVAQAKTATTGDGQTVTVDLTAGATEGPFTGAAIVSMTPAGSATTRIVDTGTGAARTFRLEVTPNARYAGSVTILYTLTNVYGVSAPASVTVTVSARPNPTADPNVRGISDAQAETTRRFARSQVANFMRRTEQLHNGGGGSNPVGMTLSSRDSSGFVRDRPAFDASALEITERMRPLAEDPLMGRVANLRDSRGNRADMLGTMGSMSGYSDPAAGKSRRSGAVAVAADRPMLSEDEEGAGSGERRNGSVAIWSGGAIDISTRDATTDRTKITATTSGLSAGADVKLSDDVLIGIGGGYGNDISHIGGSSARVRSKSSLFAAYASVSPGTAFVDGMIGFGDLSFSTRRAVATLNVNALGSRDGRYTVGAIAAGLDRQGDALRWSIYGRGEFMNARLGSYAETGAGRYNLRFDERDLSSLTGTLGGRIEFTGKTGFATVTPRLRAEWNHEFADTDPQLLDYADIPGVSLYSLETRGWTRDQFQIATGIRFAFPKSWILDVEAGLRAGSGEKAGTLRFQISKEF